MYEHSYHMDFGAKAGSYVDIFMDVIRWQNVGRILNGFTDGAAIAS
jgi:superoxide dismutase, Fe-Mn family